MTIVLGTPTVDGVREAMAALREWQYDGAPMQLHAGDIGWNYRFGTAETAAAVRTWSRNGRILAVGMLDSPTVVRMTVAPDAFQDEGLARRLVEDFSLPERGVLPEGAVSIEAPLGLLVHDLLTEEGWGVDEPWTPLFRSLAEPVEDPGVRIRAIGREQTQHFADVLRSAFNSSRPTRDYWHAMSAGPFSADVRCLSACDDRGNVAAVVTVWSAGPGKPGLVEPMGVHEDFRGHGYGRAVTVAGAAALREMGSSSVRVCTPSSNAGGIATYKAAGFEARPEVRDRIRTA
ncbi:Acetyltransferase (GNAT) family protein [Streptomyces sp. DvalAA-14]|uniref:GNAT family N-acetyltransferase n=1 Tax=unclassified Streptomyces TaxID=2593676 RepID=UPI00081B9FDD|nr:MULTISPECIES: GNAT family N-acetyltransferase [unclassified Streptomyces]MYS20822.1 GNAT family N-acetyltransferase [Streptomyces sp. SID4948]SCD77971.1 Acetyltransferase (GNAT) family protein [Streptomyces sp. DvalAA-14]